MFVFICATCLLWVFCGFVTNTIWWWPYMSYNSRKLIVCGVVRYGVYMYLYSCCPTCCTLSIWAVFPSDVALWTKCVCIDLTKVAIASLTLSTVATSSRTVLFFINWQWTVVPHAPCQMDRDATPAPLLGAESLTPVTQGTGGLQVVLVERVSQMVSGQGVIQLVHVSPYFTVILYPLQTEYSAWQFSLHNDEPWGFGTFLCISVATHATAGVVSVITMKRHIRFGSVWGLAGTEATCLWARVQWSSSIIVIHKWQSALSTVNQQSTMYNLLCHVSLSTVRVLWYPALLGKWTETLLQNHY